MAHLIQDEIVVNDHTWNLGIYVTDINASKDLLVRGDRHVGGVMMSLVDSIGKFLNIIITKPLLHYICISNMILYNYIISYYSYHF